METPLRGRSGGHAGTAPTVSFGRLRVDDWFRLGGLRVGRLISFVWDVWKNITEIGRGGAYMPARVALQGRIRRSSPAHDACIFGMETPLRERSGGHAGTAPTVSFGWIVRGQVYRSLFTPKARSFIKSKGAHQMIDALLTLFLSLLSDSNQRPRDYKSRALAN